MNLEISTVLLALIYRNHFRSYRPGIHTLGSNEAIVGELLDHVRCPSGSPGDGEDWREEVRRNSERVVDRGGVEIDVGIELLLLEHDLSDAFTHLDPFRFAEFGAQNLRHLFEVRGPWIKCLIDPVADAHNLLLLREAFGNVTIHFVQ